MVEKLKKCLDNKGSTGILLTDLSKAFDCLIHDLLLAKLHAYGFQHNAIKLIHSYLDGRSQRVRINSTYSSILGPLTINIYLSDLFLFYDDSDIANYTDDNSPLSCELNVESIIMQL